MTVEEYKFLAKQIEIFEMRIADLKEKDIPVDEKKRKSDVFEFELTNVLDVILERCMISPISVDELSIFDWIFCLLNIRLVSRGSEAIFTLRSRKEKKVERVEFSIDELIDYLENNKDRFIKNPIGSISLETGIHAIVAPITRKELKYAQELFKADENANFYLTKQALSVKGFINEDTFFYLEPEQRVRFVNTFSYKKIKELSDMCDGYNNGFFDIINEFINEKNPNTEGLDISDFILFFYDF